MQETKKQGIFLKNQQKMTGLIIFIFYVFIMTMVAKRNAKNKKKRLKRQTGQNQATPLAKGKPKRRTKKAKKRPQTAAKTNMEAVWKDLMKQAKAKTQKIQRPKTKSQPPQVVPEKEIFSYDDIYEEPGYNKNKPQKHSTTEQFTAKTPLPEAYQKKSKTKKKGFKFKAKDAIIYEVIMKRKYK